MPMPKSSPTTTRIYWPQALSQDFVSGVGDKGSGGQTIPSLLSPPLLTYSSLRNFSLSISDFIIPVMFDNHCS